MTTRALTAGAKADVFWWAAGFLTLQLGLAGLIETGLPQLRDPVYADKAAALRRLVGRDGGPAAVAVGSSRTGFGLDGGRLGGRLSAEWGRPVAVYNFGTPGAGPVMQHLT